MIVIMYSMNKQRSLVVCFSLWLLLAVAVQTVAQENEEGTNVSDSVAEEGSVADKSPILVEELSFAEETPADSGTISDGDTDIIGTSDFDSLFSRNPIIDEPSETAIEVNPQDSLLIVPGIQWGGSLRGSLTADWLWQNVWGGEFSILDPASQSLTPRIGADLYFDSRPEPVFRGFGKFKIDSTTDGGFEFSGLSFTVDDIDASYLPVGWTAEENADGDIEIRDPTGNIIATIPSDAGTAVEEEESETGVAPGLVLNVFELFADFAYKETLFFRFGKHTIHWGVGHFYSPADVLNLTSIDPEDPTADIEGPVSLRTHIPFGITGNANLYLIANGRAEPLDIAIAPKIEFAVGTGELGIGGFYQRSLAPRLVTLFSYSLGDFDLFTEGVLLYGSDRIFVRPSRDQSASEESPDDGLDLVLDTYSVDHAFFAQATVGVRYFNRWEKTLSLLFVGQYLFNGEGYGNDVTGLLPAAIRLLLFPTENGLSLDSDEQPEDYVAPPALSLIDLTNWGRHYVAATLAVDDLFGSGLGISVFGLVNLSDLSGIVTPSISLDFLERFSVSLAARFTFGDANGELTDPASMLAGEEVSPAFGITLSANMPGGSL
jgi:hypothetical protein